jgi:hypothetical protein
MITQLDMLSTAELMQFVQQCNPAELKQVNLGYQIIQRLPYLSAEHLVTCLEVSRDKAFTEALEQHILKHSKRRAEVLEIARERPKLRKLLKMLTSN